MERRAFNGYRLDIDVMLYPALEEKLRKARLALDGATSEKIVELCKQYLVVLAEYRAELYRLPKTLNLNRHSKSSSTRAEVDKSRREVRTAIEETTGERERAEGLMLWFTAISGYGAVETLNRGRFGGHDNWELRAGGVGFNDGSGSEKMSIQDAVDAASLLRREEHVARTAAMRASATLNAPVVSGKPESNRCPEGST